MTTTHEYVKLALRIALMRQTQDDTAHAKAFALECLLYRELTEERFDEMTIRHLMELSQPQNYH